MVLRFRIRLKMVEDLTVLPSFQIFQLIFCKHRPSIRATWLVHRFFLECMYSCVRMYVCVYLHRNTYIQKHIRNNKGVVQYSFQAVNYFPFRLQALRPFPLLLVPFTIITVTRICEDDGNIRFLALWDGTNFLIPFFIASLWKEWNLGFIAFCKVL